MNLERLLRSALRLPRRVAHVLRVALELAGWTLTFRLRAGLRRRRQVRLLRRSALFDVAYYLSQAGGDRAARRDPYTHYLVRGAARGFAPSPLFDGAAYLARNPEAAGENPLVHHLLADRARRAAPPPAPADSPVPRPAPGEALLAAHPFRPPHGGRNVLVVDADGQSEGGVSLRAAELVRLAREIGPVTLVCDRAAPSSGASILQGFPAALAHLEREGERYAVVLVRGLEQASRYLAPVRAYAAQATLVCDAAGGVAHAQHPREGRGAASREPVARVAAECCDLVLVDAPADREAVLRLAPGARVELFARGEAGLRAVLARSDAAERVAGGAA